MWPVGSEGSMPGQGASVITDGLSLGETVPEAPGRAGYFGGFARIICFSFVANFAKEKCIYLAPIEKPSTSPGIGIVIISYMLTSWLAVIDLPFDYWRFANYQGRSHPSLEIAPRDAFLTHDL